MKEILFLILLFSFAINSTAQTSKPCYTMVGIWDFSNPSSNLNLLLKLKQVKKREIFLS
ncbi:MAG: hypothetical protein JWN76_436 [Chitinophagaceae bacterium]|nr:hypothetical protein [Chitinophagaceae bacterium]